MENGKQPHELRLSPDLPPIKIVSDEEAEEADYVVCMPGGQGEYFDDDVRTTCASCGTLIHHRPHAPKKPKKICLECAAKLAEEDHGEQEP